MALSLVHSSKRNYTNWLHAYVKHHDNSESPPSYHYWTGVATIAGALRRRVWIEENKYQWVPNFYIVLVGPPGIVAKSTSARAGQSLLEQIPGVHLGPQSVTWQALTEALSQAHDPVCLPGEAEPQSTSCLTLVLSELGNLIKPDNKELLDVLIPLWDGQLETWSHRTKTQGSTIIKNPWLNIIGCTTPTWLQSNFSKDFFGNGLTSRMVFVYANQKHKLVAYPSQCIQRAEYYSEQQRLLDDLIQISELSGEFQLTPEARNLGVAWYEAHWNTPRNTVVAGERFDGYWARKQTHIHKLAMVISASRRNELIITHDDLQAAIAQVEALEPNMRKVFNSIGAAPAAKVSNEILGIIRTYGKISYQELWQQCFSTMESKQFVDGVNAIISAGYARQGTGPDGRIWLTYVGR